MSNLLDNSWYYSDLFGEYCKGSYHHTIQMPLCTLNEIAYLLHRTWSSYSKTPMNSSYSYLRSSFYDVSRKTMQWKVVE